jgi:hypothetical protein
VRRALNEGREIKQTGDRAGIRERKHTFIIIGEVIPSILPEVKLFALDKI